MASFTYVAMEPSGKKLSGQVTAADKDSAMALIAAEGRFVVEIRERGAAQRTLPTAVRGRVDRSQLALFTRRMADLAAAGLPLDRVLRVVSEQSESPKLTQVANLALEDIRNGLPVSVALSKYPRLFPPLYTQTLGAGEASGQFAQVATRLADLQEKQVARRSQFVSAMIYPGVLSFAALFVIVFLLTFVLPRLSEVFKNLGGSLPTPTKILLGAADFITANWLWLLIAPIVVAAIYRGWVATEAGAVYRDRLLLRLPGAGRILSKAVVSRLARTLGTLLYGGVPILEALRLSGESCGNRFIQRSAVAAAQDVREGRPLHEALTDAGGFPGVLTHMVAIGEETGDLPKMLDRVSDTLDFEVDTGMRRLTSVFEPLVVIVMGTFVGFVVLSVLLPIFEAQSWLK